MEERGETTACLYSDRNDLIERSEVGIWKRGDWMEPCCWVGERWKFWPRAKGIF